MVGCACTPTLLGNHCTLPPYSFFLVHLSIQLVHWVSSVSIFLLLLVHVSVHGWSTVSLWCVGISEVAIFLLLFLVHLSMELVPSCVSLWCVEVIISSGVSASCVCRWVHGGPILHAEQLLLYSSCSFSYCLASYADNPNMLPHSASGICHPRTTSKTAPSPNSQWQHHHCYSHSLPFLLWWCHGGCDYMCRQILVAQPPEVWNSSKQYDRWWMWVDVSMPLPHCWVHDGCVCDVWHGNI